MKNNYDAIIVGGGHNGLTAAGYLGNAGYKTLVLERRPIVGGAVVTEEFHPGYRISTISYVVSLLHSKIIEDLELKQHGFEMIKMDGTLNVCGDNFLFFNDDEDHNRNEVGRFSRTDYEAMEKFEKMFQDVGGIIRNQMLKEPPALDAGFMDLIKLGRMGLDFHKLSPNLRYRLLQILTSSAYDLIERWFESPMIKSMYGSACFSGNYASLRQPGSAIPLFHSAIGELDGEQGAWRMVKGGMGALSEAMASFARSKGVDILTDAPVEKILVKNGRAKGVRLKNGTIVNAKSILANTDPKRTFLGLVDSNDLDSEFLKDIKQIRMGHSSCRVNIALKGLPDIRFFQPGEGSWHRSDICIFPDIQGQEANYFASATGNFPADPRLEITIPSTLDDSLAPKGHHVMSVLAKYYPFKLADGVSWNTVKEKAADQIIETIAKIMPNINDLIVGRQMISPLDLETTYGLTEADIFHGRHDLDQILSMRPHPKAAQYRTPIKNLYLCGSGAHPGGGVSGAPGHNAARRVIADLKK